MSSEQFAREVVHTEQRVSRMKTDALERQQTQKQRRNREADSEYDTLNQESFRETGREDL